ncbi:MAG: bifunctional phosphoribosylaminoimidazolecarboxamide formyltransferase/IMP cyclohydrolase [Candidatus Poribacteria bacterium]|nr:bifunctional phosphoribosylaminoimidazolecarboxamide formyltransferase/IMP cyclohydrolase [Candidatus Poribacteria bacterium]
MKIIRRALISVFDKSDLLDLVQILAENGVEFLSTGQTAKHLTQSGFQVREVSDYTGFPEILDGRVKTLHPRIYGGLLAVLDNPEHVEQTAAHGIESIDLIVSNLYPFEATVQREGIELDEAIENIDIGGPTLIRAAAKNYQDVAVVTNPCQYPEIVEELRENGGGLSSETRFRLAKAAFNHITRYDAAISHYLSTLDDPGPEFPEVLNLRYEKAQELRYGENPHQKAAFYRTVTSPEPCAAWAEQLSGQPLSFNNILDLEAALEIVKDFEDPTCAIIKHNNPCGLATGKDLVQAFNEALECDRTSAFGSIIGVNRKVTIQTANTIREAAKAGIKVEAIIAPSYTEQALKALSRVKQRRILATGKLSLRPTVKQIRNVTGGLLLQDRDRREIGPDELQVVSKREPTDAELESLLFGWRACKHVKSNCILLAQGTKTVGIGAGQMSRVDSCIIAARKAGERANGSVLASDAYFPFPDGIEIAGGAGVSAIIQPGGSVNDQTVIDAANRYNMAMVLTGVRHFLH